MAGMLLVRLLIGLGPVSFGVVLALGAVTGIAGSIQDFLSTGLVPELAGAYHRRREAPPGFVDAYAAARRFCGKIAVGVLFSFLALALLAPAANLPRELSSGVRWFLAARGCEWALAILLTPLRSMCLVTERTASLNAWVVAERFADVVGAGLAVAWLGSTNPGDTIAAYGALGAAASVLAMLIASAPIRRDVHSIVGGRQPNFSPEASARLWRSVAANSVVGVAMNLYVRAALLCVQLVIGPAGSYAFGLATQFGFYLRQASMGLVLGIDGVAARVARCGSKEDLAELLKTTTRLQAIVVAPGAILVAMFTEELLALWAGPLLAEQPDSLSQIAWLVRILLIGVTARSLSEAWMRTLTGVGKASLIAPPIVVGAGVACIASGLAVTLAPAESKIVAVATVLSLALLAVHGLALPMATAKPLGLKLRDFFSTVVGPASAAALAGGVTSLFGVLFGWRMPWGMQAVSIILVYAAACGLTVLDRWRTSRLNVTSPPSSPTVAHALHTTGN